MMMLGEVLALMMPLLILAGPALGQPVAFLPKLSGDSNVAAQFVLVYRFLD